jgi:hypothetical protein
MSVTFAPAMEAMQYQISCGCGEAVAKQVFPSFEVAYKIFTSNVPFEKPVCADEDCALYFGTRPRIRAFNEDELNVNMANMNAAHILGLLGLGNDSQGGVADASWFLGKVQDKLAELPVVLAERPAFSVGRYSGYEQDVLARLEFVAAYAAERNAPVVWS